MFSNCTFLFVFLSYIALFKSFHASLVCVHIYLYSLLGYAENNPFRKQVSLSFLASG